MAEEGCYIEHLDEGNLVRCGRPVVALGMCEADYRRYQRAGESLDEVQGSPPIRPVERIGCQAPKDEFESAFPEDLNEVRQMAKLAQQRRGGRGALLALAEVTGTSITPDSDLAAVAEEIIRAVQCPNVHHSSGLCTKHYSRLRRTGTTRRTRGKNAGKTCSGSPATPKCDKPATRGGKCDNCYYNTRYHDRKKQEEPEGDS